MQPLKIYIAGPYTAPTDDERKANVETAIGAAIAIFRKGHAPYIPHLTHFVDDYAARNAITFTWDDYMRWDMPWVAACDALLYLKGSRGADLELEVARRFKKQIFMSLDEIPPLGQRGHD